eukprot:gene12496-3669_t
MQNNLHLNDRHHHLMRGQPEHTGREPAQCMLEKVGTDPQRDSASESLHHLAEMSAGAGSGPTGHGDAKQGQPPMLMEIPKTTHTTTCGLVAWRTGDGRIHPHADS